MGSCLAPIYLDRISISGYRYCIGSAGGICVQEDCWPQSEKGRVSIIDKESSNQPLNGTAYSRPLAVSLAYMEVQ